MVSNVCEWCIKKKDLLCGNGCVKKKLKICGGERVCKKNVYRKAFVWNAHNSNVYYIRLLIIG